MNNIDKHEPHGCKYVLTMGYTQLAITDTLQGVHNTTKKLIRKLKSICVSVYNVTKHMVIS
jgi:hypothetical protein